MGLQYYYSLQYIQLTVAVYREDMSATNHVNLL